ncbi:MAG: BON domain-containing protein [Opitutaceae bacterium]
MKKYILALSVLSLALVGCTKKDSDTAMDKTKDATNTAVDKTKEVASNVADKTTDMAKDTKDAIANKINEWNLTPSDIKADLQKGGEIVRTKTVAAGEKVASATDNARIVTVINAKLVGDSDLSAMKIDVDADAGMVTLKGTASSEMAIGKAIALALNTDGVTKVTSMLTVK